MNETTTYELEAFRADSRQLERMVSAIIAALPEHTSAMGSACDHAEITLGAMIQELHAYRAGGVTEEMLRRNDGAIKVGRGCEIAIAGTTKRVADLQAENDEMRAWFIATVEKCSVFSDPPKCV